MLASAISNFDNPYSFQAAIRAADAEAVITQKGEFSAELTRVDLHRLWMQRGDESLPRIMHTAISRERSPIFFLAGLGETAMHNGGMDQAAGEIVFYSSGSTCFQRTSAACHWGSMSLTPEDLAAAGCSLVGHELTAPRCTSIVRPSPGAFSRLLYLHQAAGSLARAAPEILAHPETARAIEEALVHAMISCLAEQAPNPHSFGSSCHSTVMVRFERALAAEPKRSFYLAEICAATGVSERTLRACCHEHLGMGPIRFLWLRRMHLARLALLEASRRTKTVTEIAVDHGFWELGRFATAYQALFGETPSATLRRDRDVQSASQGSPFAFADSA